MKFSISKQKISRALNHKYSRAILPPFDCTHRGSNFVWLRKLCESPNKSPSYFMNPRNDGELKRLLDSFQRTRDGVDVETRAGHLRQIGMTHWSLVGGSDTIEDDDNHLKGAGAAFEEALGLLLPGGENADVASLLHAIGTVCSRQSQNTPDGRKEAMKWYRKSLSIKKKVYGTEDHPECGKTLNGMAMLYAPSPDDIVWERRHEKQIEEGGKDAWEVDDRNDTDDIPVDPSLALELFRRAFDILAKAHGRDHPIVVSVIKNIARLQRLTGNHVEARERYLEALSFSSMDVDGPLHMASLHSSIGDCSHDLDDWQDARFHYEEALPFINHNQSYEAMALRAQLYHSLGLVLTQLKHHQLALAKLEESRRLKVAIGGEDHFEVGLTLNVIGAVYGTMEGEHSKALAYFREALRIFRMAAVDEKTGVMANDDLNVLNALANISKIEKSQSMHNNRKR